MFKNNNKDIIGYIATIIIMFAICTPVTGLITGVLFMSQNFNSLIAVLLGIVVGILIYYYVPIVCYYFDNIFKLLKR